MTGILLTLTLTSALLTGGALCVCLLRGDSEARKRLLWPLVLMAVLMLLRYGGEGILRGQNLGWRAPVKAVLGVLIAGTALVLLARIMKYTCALFSGQIWMELGSAICVTVSGGVLVLWIFLLILFGNWSDRVAEHEGVKVVVEYSGIFHETGYRYVNPLIRGEKVYEWSD